MRFQTAVGPEACVSAACQPRCWTDGSKTTEENPVAAIITTDSVLQPAKLSFHFSVLLVQTELASTLERICKRCPSLADSQTQTPETFQGLQGQSAVFHLQTCLSSSRPCFKSLLMTFSGSGLREPQQHLRTALLSALGLLPLLFSSLPGTLAMITLPTDWRTGIA